MSSRASPLPHGIMASAAELLHQAFRVLGYAVDHPDSEDFRLHISSRRFRHKPHVGRHCDVPLMLLVFVGSFGRSGSLPDSDIIISYYRNFGSADWIAWPFGTTENQISHSWIVCPFDQWIRVIGI